MLPLAYTGLTASKLKSWVFGTGRVRSSLRYLEFQFGVLVQFLEIQVAIARLERLLNVVSATLLLFRSAFAFAAPFRVGHGHVMV